MPDEPYNPFGDLQDDTAVRLVAGAGLHIDNPIGISAELIDSPGALNDTHEEYSYAVSYKNGAGRTTLTDISVCAAITAGHKAQLNFAPAGPNATGIEIWRSWTPADPTDLRLLATVAIDSESYEDEETNVAFAARSGDSPAMPTENTTLGNAAANYIAPVPIITEVKGDIQNRIDISLGRKGLKAGSTNKIGAAILVLTPRGRGLDARQSLTQLTTVRVSIFIDLKINAGGTGLQVDPLALQTAVMHRLVKWRRGPGQAFARLTDWDSIEDTTKGELNYFSDWEVPLTLSDPGT